MADISATPSSEKMTNLITDYSGDPVTLDDNLGLRPRARAVSGLRPCARAFSGSAPRLASVKGDSRMSTTPSSCRLRPCPHRRRDLRYNPEHHARSKHVLRRHFYVRDAVESFEITVPLVKTADNLADFLTKIQPVAVFRSMRNRIMGNKH